MRINRACVLGTLGRACNGSLGTLLWYLYSHLCSIFQLIHNLDDIDLYKQNELVIFFSLRRHCRLLPLNDSLIHNFAHSYIAIFGEMQSIRINEIK